MFYWNQLIVAIKLKFSHYYNTNNSIFDLKKFNQLNSFSLLNMKILYNIYIFDKFNFLNKYKVTIFLDLIINILNF